MVVHNMIILNASKKAVRTREGRGRDMGLLKEKQPLPLQEKLITPTYSV